MAKYVSTFEDEYTEKLKKKLDNIYGQAEKETQAKLDKYLSSFHDADAKKQAALAKGEITNEQYTQWRINKMMGAQQWMNLRDSMAESLTKTNRIAMAYANDLLPDAFRAGYNATGNDIVKGISFNLVDKETVRMLTHSNRTLLPYIYVDGKRDVRWNTKQLNAAVMQGILQGESVDKIAKRMEGVFGKTERGWMTNARTAVNSAENKGRQWSYERLADDGVDVWKEWVSSADGHTRPSHQGMPIGVGGEVVPYNDTFSNELEYPGDPDGDEAEIYNCRCSMVANIKGFKHKNYSKSRIDRENKVTLGNAIYDKKDEIEEYKKASLEDGTWEVSGVWKDNVTLDDYEAKAGSIQAKIDYFEKQMAKYPNDSEEYLKFRNLRDATLEYSIQGKEYSGLKSDLDAMLKQMAQLDNGGAVKGTASGPFSPDAYTQARKDKALWFTSRNGGKKAADAEFREQTGKVWKNASEKEKDCAYEYTVSYHKYNEPLRGIEYGTSKYLGVGNINFDEIAISTHGKGEMRKRIGALTDIIDKSQLQKDTWFNRGCQYNGMDKFFQCTMDLLQNGTQADLEKALLGKTVTEYGFMSTSSMKGDGFSGPIMLNIYAPSGTKALYVEPFSGFGNGDGREWDGDAKQRSFSKEFETLFQQGTELRITKVERKSRYDTIWFDLEVVGQGKQQR